MTTSGVTPTVSWQLQKVVLWQFWVWWAEFIWSLQSEAFSRAPKVFRVDVWKIIYSIIKLPVTSMIIYTGVQAFSLGATCLLWSSSLPRSGGSADVHDFRISVDTDLPGMIDRPSNVELLVDQSCYGCSRNLISWGDEVSSCHLASLWKV